MDIERERGGGEIEFGVSYDGNLQVT